MQRGMLGCPDFFRGRCNRRDLDNKLAKDVPFVLTYPGDIPPWRTLAKIECSWPTALR